MAVIVMNDGIRLSDFLKICSLVTPVVYLRFPLVPDLCSVIPNN